MARKKGRVVVRGGRKRPYKKRGRGHAAMKRNYELTKREAGMIADASGKWLMISQVNLSEKTKQDAQKQQAHIGTNRRHTRPWKAKKLNMKGFTSVSSKGPTESQVTTQQQTS
jgi:hypothetical protein